MTAAPPARLIWSTIILGLALGIAAAANGITPPANNFSPSEDVELGRDASAEVRRQITPVDDATVREYIQELGQRLVDAIPTPLRQPAFMHSFDVLNVKGIASFGLPGGPVFITRGMAQTARSEGELSGIVAHELSHVVLRHGTAQATAGEPFQIGAITGRDIGAIIGGSSGHGILAQGSGFAASSYFLRYCHHYERQADLLATQLMANAGYDPEDLVTMFEAIHTGGAGRGVRWFRAHPNPDDLDEDISREEFIRRAAERLPIEVASDVSDRFEAVQERLGAMPVHKAKHGSAGAAAGVNRQHRIEVPAGAFQSATAGDSLHLSVPANWNRVPGGNAVTFAPEGASLDTLRGAMDVTHGMQIGVARSLTGDLQTDTQALLQSFSETNPNVRWTPAFQVTSIAGQSGLTTTFSNVSGVTGDFEQVSLSTAHLPNGSFLYVIGIAPQEDAGVYRGAFNRVLESLQIVN